MTVLISDFKTRLQSKIHGSSLNKVQDVYNLIYEGAGNFLLRVDAQESIRSSLLSNALYDQVYNYTAPADLKGDKVIDFRPQANRTSGDNFNAVYSEEFDRNKFGGDFTVENKNGVKSLRIAKTLYSGVTLNDSNTLTENGTWAATASAQNLAADTFYKLSGSASLRFDLAASGSTGYIENSTMTAVDASSIKNNGAIFIPVYLSTAANVTSVALRWGSSSSDYYSVTVTTTTDATAFVDGWNILRFDWYNLTPTGTPVDTAIDYLRVTLAYNGTATPYCRVDNIVARRGELYETIYYSKYLFRSSAGVWKDKPTADDDYIILDTEAANCLLYEVAEIVGQELQGEDATFDITYLTNKKKEAWGTYLSTYKSQSMKPATPYYRGRVLRRR